MILNPTQKKKNDAMGEEDEHRGRMEQRIALMLKVGVLLMGLQGCLRMWAITGWEA